jgi:hypothetical protein
MTAQPLPSTPQADRPSSQPLVSSAWLWSVVWTAAAFLLPRYGTRLTVTTRPPAGG